MNKKISLLFIVVLIFFIACSDETTVFVDDLQDESNVIVENDAAKLQGSISFAEAGVLDIVEQEELANKSRSSYAKQNEPAGDYPLTLIAQISPPTFGGSNNLGASHVHIDGNYAYVSYNTVGQEYYGAIQIINIGDPNDPRITSQLIYTNADMNAIQYSDGFVYVVGGVDAEKSVTATDNSLIAKIQVANGRMDLSAGVTYAFQIGFNANDIAIEGNSVLVTSGRDGTLSSYNKSDLTIQNETPYGDLRSIAYSNGNIAVLDVDLGVRVLDAGFQQIKEIPISTDFGSASKRTLDFSGDKIVVPEADKGAGIYSFSSGSLIEYVPILINPDGVDPADIVTVAVATNDDIMLMANGGAGLCLVETLDDSSNAYGIIELDGSTNYVASKGDYIFSASGRRGLQIIKLNRPDTSLEARCATLPFYTGSNKLTVAQGETVEFQGAKRFNNMNISGSLLLCGSWTVRNDVNVNDDALFEMNGLLTVGRNNRRRDITVDEGATLRIEGSLTIYGDLILNDGATIEFIGAASTANIFGSVIKNGTTNVLGTFDDVQDKF